MMGRRSFLTGAAASALPGPARPDDHVPLKDIARRRGLYFGTASTRFVLERDPRYERVIARECDAFVFDWDTKWEATEPVRGRPDYVDADWIAARMIDAGLRLRGHPLVWAQSLPAWVMGALDTESALPLMLGHVRTTTEHFRGRVRSWDVVNEAIEPRDGRPDGLRGTSWLKAIGPSYLDRAFLAAHEVDGGVELVYNEAELDYADDWSSQRRAATLRLLEGFRVRGVPCHALGIQAHLWATGRRFDAVVMADFLRSVAGLGYRIIVTELDVNDRGLDGDAAQRDRAVADMARRYLDVVLDESAVKGVLTWGLTDRYSWLNRPGNFPDYARQDGIASRPLPLDASLNPKPFWDALRTAFLHAPDRTPS